MPVRAEAPELNATAASILGFLLLAPEPMSGGDLAARIEDVIGDFWNVTRSQIYRELKLLADQALVATVRSGPRDKQPYRITPAGGRAFRAWIAHDPGPPIMRMPLVLQVFFGEALAPEDLVRSLTRMRAYHAGRLATYREFENQVERGTFPHHALRLGLMFQETILAWIDSLPKAKKRRARR
jgi:DNA-binding PadR family transcriptional regulator